MKKKRHLLEVKTAINGQCGVYVVHWIDLTALHLCRYEVMWHKHLVFCTQTVLFVFNTQS